MFLFPLVPMHSSTAPFLADAGSIATAKSRELPGAIQTGAMGSALDRFVQAVTCADSDAALTTSITQICGCPGVMEMGGSPSAALASLSRMRTVALGFPEVDCAAAPRSVKSSLLASDAGGSSG